jgi:hypothetical protein
MDAHRINIVNLVDDLGVDAATVYLVAKGVKPAGELGLPPRLKLYLETEEMLQSLGLDSYIHRVNIEGRCRTPEDLKTATSFSREVGGDLEFKGDGEVVVRDVPQQLMYWKPKAGVDREQAAHACRNKQDHQSFGELMGYPQCCVETFQGTESVIAYHSALRDRVSEQGVDGIAHLVGTQHIPHTLDCGATREAGYASFLAKHAPFLHATELHTLLGRLTAVLS